jgi:hypothetical protein
MFAEVRAFDWLMLGIEALVLLLIAYEVKIGIRERAKQRKQELELTNAVAFLSGLMSKGDHIRRDIPSPYEIPAGGGLEEQEQWVSTKRYEWQQRALRWIRESNEEIAKRSQRAASVFMLIAEPPKATPVQVTDKPIGYSFTIVGNDREVYQRLVALLDNLRRIIEKPEAYF